MLRLNAIRWFEGRSGLDEPTAVAEIDCDGPPADGFDTKIASAAEQLLAGPALSYADDSHCPAGCSEGTADDQANPNRRLGEWLVAVAVTLQRRAGDPVWNGRVAQADSHRIRLALPWCRRDVARAALDVAIRLVEQWVAAEPDEAVLGGIVADLVAEIDAARSGGLDPGTFRYVDAAHRRGIPVESLPGAVQLGWGANADRMRDGQNNEADVLGVAAADDRLLANQLMANGGVPLPDGAAVTDVPGALQVADRTGWPVVVKPVKRRAGDRVLRDIRDPAALERACFASARDGSPSVIVEQQIAGDSHRLVIVNGRLLSGAGVPAVHPDNARLAARVARLVGVRCAAVDVVSTDIGRSWREVGAVVCGVNPRPLEAAPPSAAVDILDIVFGHRSGRIPTAAVSGTGASAVAALLHAIWLATGATAGVCTSAGAWVGRDLVGSGDLSGQPGGRILLTDPAVQAAILEVPGRRALDLGHPCDRYDVAAVLPTAADLAGRAEILARTVDAVVFDAADPDLPALRARAGADRHILVDTGARRLIDDDGRAVAPSAAVADLPAGQARTALFAAALALAQGIGTATVAGALAAAPRGG